MVNILVVEDDSKLNQIVCTYLNDNGYAASNGISKVEQTGVDEIPWHEAAVEQQCEENKKCERASERKCRPGKRIGKRGGDDHADHGTEQRDESRHSVRPENLVEIVREVLIGIQAEFGREHGITVDLNGFFVRQGNHHNQQQRKNRQRRVEEKYDMDEPWSLLSGHVIVHSFPEHSKQGVIGAESAYRQIGQ